MAMATPLNPREAWCLTGHSVSYSDDYFIYFPYLMAPALVSVCPCIIKQLINLKRKNQAIGLIGSSEIVAPAGVWLPLWAIAIQLVATAMIVGGITIIYLS